MKKRRGPHAPGCRHCIRVRALGLEYQQWRASWDSRLELVACGYDAEGHQFRSAQPAPMFRDFLIQMTGSGWPMSGTAPARRWAA